MISKLTLLLAHSLANKLDRSTPCNIFSIYVNNRFKIIWNKVRNIRIFPSISLEYNVVVPIVNII